jgi:NAD(P)-dependent dehydrogenase (short-subunit alcohol dehydrogenase family)
MRDVAGKVALITGGASGIGFGIARVFLRSGMKVIIVDNNAKNLEDAADRVRGVDGVHIMQLDVADRAAVLRAADEAERVFGKLHVLCNNAGVGGGGSVDDPDFADWDWLMSINFGGVVNGVKAFVPKLKAHGEGGHIINTSSMAGITPLPNEGGAYTTSKFAVRGLTESLRLTLAVHNIGVSLLCPGLTNTRILRMRASAPARAVSRAKAIRMPCSTRWRERWIRLKSAQRPSKACGATTRTSSRMASSRRRCASCSRRSSRHSPTRAALRRCASPLRTSAAA